MTDPLDKEERPNWLFWAVAGMVIVLAAIGYFFVNGKAAQIGMEMGKKSVAVEAPAEALQKQIEAAQPPVQTAAGPEATEEEAEEPAAPAEPEKMELLATTPNCKVFYTYDSYNFVYVVESTSNKTCTVSTVNTR